MLKDLKIDPEYDFGPPFEEVNWVLKFLFRRLKDQFYYRKGVLPHNAEFQNKLMVN